MSTSMKKLRGSNWSMMSGELLVKSGMSRVARESIPQIPAAKKILPQSVFWREVTMDVGCLRCMYFTQ